MRFLSTLSFLLGFFCSVHAGDEPYTAQKIEQMFPKSDTILRIKDLWPSDYTVLLPIEPAIPDNFILKTIPRDINPYGYFLWGPKEVLDAFDINDPQSLTGPIFHLYTSMQITQLGPKSFSHVDQLEKDCKEEKVENLTLKNFMWGRYPAFTFEGKRTNGRDLTNAWIGLNYCSRVLVVKLAIPVMEGRPNDEDRALWKTFLSKTKELPEPDCFLAQGFDMQLGYTHFEPNGAKLTFIAEQRKSDKTLQVVVFPRSTDTTYSFKKIEQGFAGTTWRRGAPIIKIILTVTKKIPEGGSIIWTDIPITVFLKHVDEFSLDKEALEHNKSVFVLQKK